MLSIVISKMRKSGVIQRIRYFDFVGCFLDLPLVFHLRKLKYKIEFDFGSTARFFGVFGSYRKAFDNVSGNTFRSYADTDLSDINRHSFQQMHLFDYPILYWLVKVFGEYKSVIDLGGHVGVKFYAYQEQFPELKDIKWQVIEVPSMIKKGQEIAEHRGVRNICFMEDINCAQPAEILFISGALQYLEVSLDQIFEMITVKPEYVFLNKLPLHDGQDLWTLENFGKAKIPYGIFNRSAFHSIMEHRGYTLRSKWTIDSRSISIPFHEKVLENFVMEGHVWQLQNTTGNC